MDEPTKVLCADCLEWFDESTAGYDDGKLSACRPCTEKRLTPKACTDPMEDFYRNAIKRGEFRLVLSSKRARKLRRRGEDVRWSTFHNGWVWDYWKAHAF